MVDSVHSKTHIRNDFMRKMVIHTPYSTFLAGIQNPGLWNRVSSPVIFGSERTNVQKNRTGFIRKELGMLLSKEEIGITQFPKKLLANLIHQQVSLIVMKIYFNTKQTRGLLKHLSSLGANKRMFED